MSALSAPLLRTLASVPVGSRILEMRNGNDTHTVAMASLGLDVTVCVDSRESADRIVSEVSRAEEAQGVDVRVVDLRNLPFAEQSFDWVISLDGLRFGDRSMLSSQMAELRRVLVSGGWLYTRLPDWNDPSVPLTPPGWSELLEAHDLAVAQEPRYVDGDIHRHVIYRRVDASTRP